MSESKARSRRRAPANGKPPKEAAAEAKQQADQGEDQIQVDAAIHILIQRDGQNVKVDVVPEGDLRPAELPVLLEVAQRRGRELAGL